MSASASVPSSSSEYRVAPAKYSASLHEAAALSEQQASQLEGTCAEWRGNIERVLFSSAVISERVGALAAAISLHYAGQRVLCVGLLTGAFVFLSDLVRRLTIPYQVDFMVVSSYGRGTSSTGSVRLKKDMSLDPAGCHVLIIEDLIDSGTTLAWLRTHLQTKRCRSLAICCLLDKQARRSSEVQVDFTGFDCPDEFVVGYGMDYADDYRCLPYIAVLKPKAYTH